MSKIKLEIRDPQALERGEQKPIVPMTYGDTDSPIVLDTETSLIECEAQNKSARINDWVVDFKQSKMKLATDTPDENYHKIDVRTAISMVGQLVNEGGLDMLQKFLASLKSIPNDPSKPSDSSEGDTPTEKKPE